MFDMDDMDDDEKDMRGNILDQLISEMHGSSLKDMLSKKLGDMPSDADVHVVAAKSGEVPVDQLRAALEGSDSKDDDGDGMEDALEDMGIQDPDEDEEDDGDDEMSDSSDDDDKKAMMSASNPFMRKIMAARMKSKMG